MAESNAHPDDERQSALDDREEAHLRALDREDRKADYAPAPNPPARVEPVTENEFFDAFERAIAIWNAADDKDTLARGLGTEVDDMLRLAKSLIPDSVAAYLAAGASDPIDIAHYTLSDAMFIGVLVGRELPR